MTKPGHRPLGMLLVCVAIGIMFLVSLGLPVFYDRHDREVNGALCLIFGLFGFPSAWLANPGLLVWYVLFLNRLYRPALGLSFACVVLALTSFLLKEFPSTHGGTDIVAYGPGFLLWHLSFGAALLISFIMCELAESRLREAEKKQASASNTHVPGDGSNR